MDHLVTPDSTRIPVEVRGEGPPVVLCHGTPWSSATWRPVADALAADHTVHTWDMPGYGATTADPPSPVDLASQSARFAWLMRRLGLDDGRTTVVAHDIGGAVALGAHLRHDLSWTRLVLVDAVVRRPWGSDLYRLVQEHHEVFGALPAPMHRALLREYVSGALAPAGPDAGTPDGLVDELCAPWLGAAGQAAFYRQIHQVRHADTDVLESLLSRVAGEVDLVWGAEDTWLPLEQGRALAEVLGAPLRVVPGAGHLVPLERPDAVVDVVRRVP